MPSDQPLIEARGLSKRYRRDRGRIIESMGMHHLLGELAGMPWRTARRMLRPTEPARSSDDDGTFWALENARGGLAQRAAPTTWPMAGNRP